jgi:hypothetical protein
MRNLAFALLGVFLLTLSPVHAEGPVVQAAIAVDGDTPPATAFAPVTPRLSAYFRTTGTQEGDELRGVWIAVDTSGAAPPDFKIDESTLTADKDDFFGAFSLSKPNNGWPVGKYRFDMFLNGKLATSAQFSID